MQTDSSNGEAELSGGGGGGGVAGGGGGGGNSSNANVRSYECNFCKRGFSNAQALGGHMNIHRRDRATKALMKPGGAYNYQRNPHYFGANYYCASSSNANVDMKKGRKDDGVDERGQRKVDVDAGELDLELRLWPDSTGRHKDSSRLKDFF